MSNQTAEVKDKVCYKVLSEMSHLCHLFNELLGQHPRIVDAVLARQLIRRRVTDKDAVLLSRDAVTSDQQTRNISLSSQVQKLTV